MYMYGNTKDHSGTFFLFLTCILNYQSGICFLCTKATEEIHVSANMYIVEKNNRQNFFLPWLYRAVNIWF